MERIMSAIFGRIFDPAAIPVDDDSSTGEP
jgi:hypothetical protein